jgi:hypoxanthine phosphoribosyltransferase
MMPFGSDIAEILISEKDLQKRVRQLGRQISKDYAEMNPYLISVLKGGLYFLADLTRTLTIPHSIDFLAISSYGTSSKSGEVRITKDLDESIAGRHVLIVEDIVDTGLTLSYISRNLERRSPASLTICTFLDRPYRRIADVPIKYKGFDVPDKYLVGYGLDWRQKFRNLPYLGILKSDKIEEV